MHSIVTTPGFIIDSRAHGEADKVYSIFTRDLGLVRAVAQGIRLEKSKLRYHVENYTLGTFSMVRGKEIWRLTSAQEFEGNLDLTTEKSAGELMARIALLLRRVLHGEEPNQELFGHILACAQFLDTQVFSLPMQIGTKNVPISIGEQSDVSFTPRPTKAHPQSHEFIDTRLQSLESLTVLRILHSLGYVGNDADIRDFLINSDITPDLLEEVSPKRTTINKHINKAIQESHL